MGFKLPGKSVTSGTSAHSSALKMKEQADAASALKQMEITKEELKGSGARIATGDKITVSATGSSYSGKLGKEHKLDPSKKTHKAILETRWKKGDKAAGGKLNELVAQRKGLKKGSAEYAAVQNQINKALGSKKVHKGTATPTPPKVKPTTTTTTSRGGKKVKKTTDTKAYTKTTKLKGSGKKGEGATVSGVEGVRKAKTKITYKDKDRDVKLKTKYSPTGEVTKEKKTVKEDDVVTKTITKGDKTRVKTRKKGGTGLGRWLKSKLKRKNK